MKRSSLLCFLMKSLKKFFFLLMAVKPLMKQHQQFGVTEWDAASCKHLFTSPRTGIRIRVDSVPCQFWMHYTAQFLYPVCLHVFLDLSPVWITGFQSRIQTLQLRLEGVAGDLWTQRWHKTIPLTAARRHVLVHMRSFRARLNVMLHLSKRSRANFDSCG